MEIVVSKRKLWSLVAASVLFATSGGLLAVGAQEKQPGKKAALPLGTPALWREPRDIATRNLLLGAGGESMKPNLSKITFIEERESESSAKFRVRDASGREWQVKIGDGAQHEVSAARLIWAAGYYTEVAYFVPRIEIDGKGVFQNARFEARSKGVKRLDEWLWDDNPFIGTNELQGLKVLLALLDNWNLKKENNKILFARDGEGDTSELRYIISDLDSKLDKTGLSPGLWYLAPKSKFIEKVKDNFVDFGYHGKHKERLSGVTVAQAKWIGGWLARLSDQQIKDALQAGGYTTVEIQQLAKTLRGRIDELTNLK